MTSFFIIVLLGVIQLFTHSVVGAPAAAPVSQPAEIEVAAGSYWLASIARQGTAAYGSPSHQVFRNVRDFGAKGDGESLDL
jgi:glucan 1,3-beta-glucosidase